APRHPIGAERPAATATSHRRGAPRSAVAQRNRHPKANSTSNIPPRERVPDGPRPHEWRATCPVGPRAAGRRTARDPRANPTSPLSLSPRRAPSALLLDLRAHLLVAGLQLGRELLAEVRRLEHRPDLDLRLLARHRVRAAAQPLDRLLHRLDLPDPVAG